MALGFLRLFREIVLKVWKKERELASTAVDSLDAQIAKLRLRLDQLKEAFVFERRVDKESNERQRDKLREEVTLAEIARQDARPEETDIEGLMAFAEHLLEHARRLGAEGKLKQRQAIFPEGLTFDGARIGTGVTCLAFMQLPVFPTTPSGVASPGVVWEPLPARSRQVPGYGAVSPRSSVVSTSKAASSNTPV